VLARLDHVRWSSVATATLAVILLLTVAPGALGLPAQPPVRLRAPSLSAQLTER